MQEYASILVWLYFDYFMSVENATFEDFKRIQMDATEVLIDRIQDKYCDHVEGALRQIP